ncbi:MAG: hypothetical protein ACREPD_00945 [Stenotrophomonas sp.]|uniref:hypothetical protein n=1 Tax=Stenotrophomonas sp. TaxID=69392 RepID=UPI003D6D7D8A
MPNIPAFASAAPAAPPSMASALPAAAAASPAAPWLRSVLNVTPHSALAVPVAAGLGAGVGAALALAFQGIGNLLPGTGVGALLGTGWLCALRGFVQSEQSLQMHQARVDALKDYPAAHELLKMADTCLHDVAAVKRLSDRVERDVRAMCVRFQQHCDEQGLKVAPLMEQVLRHFFLLHCSDRGILVVSRGSTQECYLVAAHAQDQEPIRAALNRKGASPSAVLRNLRCPFIRADLVNEHVHGATSFQMERDDVEYIPAVASPARHAAHSPAPDVPAAATQPRRRFPRLHGAIPAATRAAAGPGAAPPTPPAPRSIVWGQILTDQIGQLPVSGRTLTKLAAITEDLQAGRVCGKPVTLHGVHYSASDIQLEGLNGRNLWRLLHRRTPAGHELVGIVDYHEPRRGGSRTRWWEP